jgi:ABC-type sulfate transport system permease subunit
MTLSLSKAQARAALSMPWLNRSHRVISWLWLGALPLLLFLVLPLVALLLRVRPGLLAANLAQPQVIQAISLSLTTTTLSTLLTLLLGTPLAYLLARRRFRGRQLIDTLLDLPMVLPPSVAGIALLIAYIAYPLCSPTCHLLRGALCGQRAVAPTDRCGVALDHNVGASEDGKILGSVYTIPQTPDLSP